MNNKQKWFIWLGILAGIILWVIGLGKISHRLTYIERTCINAESERSIGITDSNTVLEQEVIMPYELFWGMDIKIGTYGRNNNSFWKVELKEAISGKLVYEWEFNASQVSDGEQYALSVKTPVAVKKGESYVIRIFAKNATGNSALAFYASDLDLYEEGSLFQNGQERDGDLCIYVFGGEKDGFWRGIYLGVSGILLAVIVWCIYRIRKGKSVRVIMEALGIACVYFLLMYIFSRDNMGTFTDECDNIRGGMLIAKGKVLYRDYYTQHTPFGYYLCALFALLGAGSIQQFRLLYYLILAIVWGGLYYRHQGYFGKIKMLCLPIIQVVILVPMFFQASKILGDNIQGICMVVLLLEYLRYWQDEQMGKSRSLIVAACIFISITSTFVSVFALAPIVIGVLVKEVFIWQKKGQFGLKEIIQRYATLIMGTVIPFVLTFVYFVLNHAIRQMYQMAYQFNTMVYNEYQNQFGRVKWKPFFLGVKNFFVSISDNFNTMITASGNASAVIQCIIAVVTLALMLTWATEQKKGEKVIAVIALLMSMCGNGTRSGTDFHAVGLWNVAITVVILLGMPNGIYQRWKEKKFILLMVTALGSYMLQPFVTMVGDHIVYHPSVINEVDEQVVAMTESGEGIFIDTFIHDSIYLMYKERYPVNRNCYILPWYMDWYEHDTLQDLEENKPRILVYRPETEVYGQTDFCPALNQAIQSRYERMGEGAILWKLK